MARKLMTERSLFIAKVKRAAEQSGDTTQYDKLIGKVRSRIARIEWLLENRPDAKNADELREELEIRKYEAEE